MGACCEKSDNQNQQDEEDYKVVGGEIYRQSLNDNNFLRLHNYEELKKLLNELLTKIKSIYWHEYEQYLLEQLQEINKYKQYVSTIEGSLQPQLFLEIMDAKFLLQENIIQNYDEIKVEIQINRLNKEKCIKFKSNTEQIYLPQNGDLSKRSDLQQNKKKKWVYWNQFTTFDLEDTKQQDIQEEKNQENLENQQNKENQQNNENKENNEIQQNSKNSENQQNKEDQLRSNQGDNFEVPSQPKVSVITGKRVIDFSNGVQKHSFQIKMVGFNKKKKKNFQIGDTEEFMLFELLDQQDNPRQRQKTMEIRDKNESLMVEELNSFISRQNTFIFNRNTKSNTQSSNQSVNPDSVSSSN
ncbi:hypothetical protein PPERSA_07271 [Pseudocohnilembus persalinus]|uniref:Uncharacterized protein n=1 Tax=Pseudocohnilembus persalinus TaxID=266149 RepID=A0A0V0QCY1_PSEPJ|nr:hypothetical protein PPERSA_07271 [Pseudocohnilembus persalinus]|eukprot:KRX00074.1 hypothetical protein PPERSA_07271 [Pseudocohnilembus persalinus]